MAKKVVKAVKKTVKAASPKKTTVAKTTDVKKTVVKKDSQKKESAKKDLVKKDSAKNDLVKKDSAKKDSTKKNLVKKGSVKKAADEKKIIYLVNIRISAEDKIRLKKAAGKEGLTFQKFAAAALKNRYDGNAPVKTIARKRYNDLDAVITCRMTPAQKRKVKAAAKAEGTSISAYILATVFGQY